MRFLLNEFMETRPEIDSKSLKFGHHESTFTNMEVLNELSENTKFEKPYVYYFNYLNKVVKGRLAEEMAVSFAPLIAMRLAQELKPTVLFPTKSMAVPKAHAYIAPGVQVRKHLYILYYFYTLISLIYKSNKLMKLKYTISIDTICRSVLIKSQLVGRFCSSMYSKNYCV